MQTPDLIQKKCIPCEGGVEPFDSEKIGYYLAAVPTWTVVEDNKKLTKEFIFKNFKEALTFVNKVGDIAESEGHHPDINLHDYKKVTITLWTHAIAGLSENDFIVAAKTDIL